MIEYEISDSERIFLKSQNISVYELFNACLLYTSDAADEL